MSKLAPTRFVLLLLGIFAAVAMILTAVGLYGVISYTVRQRTAEIGVRMAFGAEKRHILKMVAGRGFGLTAFGLVLGVGGTLGLGRFVGSLLYGVSATDPATLSRWGCSWPASACWLPTCPPCGPRTWIRLAR